MRNRCCPAPRLLTGWVHLSWVEVETMHRVRMRQLDLLVESDRLWGRLPESTRVRSEALLSRLVLEVVQAEARQRRTGDEREDHIQPS